MRYPGGKNSGGAYQTIINQMPPHETYIEAFCGSAPVLRFKRPARANIAIDVDAISCANLASLNLPRLEIICGDARAFLACYPWTGAELVYLDPPYLMSTRSSGRAIYPHEFATEAEHLELLSLLLTITAEAGSRIVISGYASGLYDELLCSWRRVSFPMVTRGGTMADEVLWMNYPEPMELHDYRYLGSGFRERERIKRKMARWTGRLHRMPTVERYAMLAALDALSGSGLAESDDEDLHARNDDASGRIATPDDYARAMRSTIAVPDEAGLHRHS